MQWISSIGFLLCRISAIVYQIRLLWLLLAGSTKKCVFPEGFVDLNILSEIRCELVLRCQRKTSSVALKIKLKEIKLASSRHHCKNYSWQAQQVVLVLDGFDNM